MNQVRIQLVVTDIDGTFLDSQNAPSHGAVEAIKAIQQRGVHFTLCTGRGDPSTRPFIQLLHLDTPYIVSGGAAIHDVNGRGIIKQHLLNHEQIEFVIELGQANACEIFMQTAMDIFVLAGDEFWSEVTTWEWMKGFPTDSYHRIFHWQDAPIEQVIRMDYFHRPEVLVHLNQQINESSIGLEAVMMRRNIEISQVGVNKGSAVEILADHLNISMEDVMVLGDGSNDLSMLQKAGLPVAMQNASPAIKLAARVITPSSDAGGLAWALHNLMSGNFEHIRTHR
jgi:hypothetical protein